MNATTDSATLRKAVVRAASQLGVSDALPEILGISSDAASGLARGERALEHGSREWDIALRFVGLYRSLISILGDAQKAKAWLAAPHHKLEPTPAALLRSEAGRDRLLRYVDAVQKYEIRMR